MGTTQALRLVLVDDHTLFREGLRTMLDAEDGFEVVTDADSADDIVELVWQTRPDLLLLDIRMPTGSGLDAIPAILKISPDTRVLVLTASDDPEEHLRAFHLGARAVVLKDSARHTLLQAIRTVCSGERWVDPRMADLLERDVAALPAALERPSQRHAFGLTDRELEIVRLVATGHKNKEVANELRISERTVKTHLTNIFHKLGVRDRVGLVMYALKKGIAPAP